MEACSVRWDYSLRRRRLAERLVENGHEIALVTKPQNLYYFTGYWGAGCLITDGDRSILLTPQLEENRALSEAVGCEVRTVTPFQRVSEAVQVEVGSRRALADDLSGSLGFPLQLEKARVTEDARPFTGLRRIKDPQERSCIRHAAEIIDRLFRKFVEVAKPGASERELGAALVYEAMKMGAEPPAISTSISPLIVASGPRAAFPHANLTERRLEEGDTVVVDLAFRWEGYYADATRTFIVGRPSADVLEAYAAVEEALMRAQQLARPGARCQDIDAAVRGVLEKYGVSKYFVHSTGHGVGLDIHEPPSLRQGSDESLREEDVITLEPGVYVRDRYGIRIENTVSVGEGVLNGFPTEMVII
jgi:Xaa-Pro aminopeptidase